MVVYTDCVKFDSNARSCGAAERREILTPGISPDMLVSKQYQAGLMIFLFKMFPFHGAQKRVLGLFQD